MCCRSCFSCVYTAVPLTRAVLTQTIRLWLCRLLLLRSNVAFDRHTLKPTARCYQFVTATSPVGSCKSLPILRLRAWCLVSDVVPTAPCLGIWGHESSEFQEDLNTPTLASPGPAQSHPSLTPPKQHSQSTHQASKPTYRPENPQALPLNPKL